MVEQDMGPEVRMQALDDIIPKVYQAAMVEHKLVPVSDPVLENLKMDEGEPISLDLTVEIRPDVEAKDYNDLPLTEYSDSLEDGAVDEVLKRLQESRAIWNAVDRESRDGDKVMVDIVPEGEDGEPDLEKKVEDYPFEVGVEGNFEAFNDALSGVKAGDERSISVVYPDDYFSEDLRGKSMTYQATVKAVQEKSLPEMDDAFASSMADGQTLLELRAKTRDELLSEKKRQNQQRTRDQITDLLIERNAVELPPSLVNQYLDSAVEELKSRNAASGREIGDEEIAAYREGGREAAERTLRAMILLDSVRTQEDIKVEAEDIDAHIEEVARENNFPAAEYRDYIMKSGQIERLAHDLAEQKTLAFLQSRAQITPAGD